VCSGSILGQLWRSVSTAYSESTMCSAPGVMTGGARGYATGNRHDPFADAGRLCKWVRTRDQNTEPGVPRTTTHLTETSRAGHVLPHQTVCPRYWGRVSMTTVGWRQPQGPDEAGCKPCQTKFRCDPIERG
jgi:hypothetical protein